MYIPVLIQQRVSAWQAIIRMTKNIIRVCTQLYGNWELLTIYIIMFNTYNIKEHQSWVKNVILDLC
jgi:hypothetical protein